MLKTPAKNLAIPRFFHREAVVGASVLSMGGGLGAVVSKETGAISTERVWTTKSGTSLKNTPEEQTNTVFL